MDNTLSPKKAHHKARAQVSQTHDLRQVWKAYRKTLAQTPTVRSVRKSIRNHRRRLESIKRALEEVKLWR